MNDRKTLDQMTSNDLDALHERVERAEAAVAMVAVNATEWAKHEAAEDPGDAALAVGGRFLLKAMELAVKHNPYLRTEAAIARVRKACDSVKAADQGHTPTVDWVVMRVLEAIDARLVNGASVAGRAATQATEAARDEAIRQLDADPHGLNTGMIVKPYTDHGLQRWVFRCWGTDTCDGWLSLDHYSEQSALRARDQHVTEEH